MLPAMRVLKQKRSRINIPRPKTKNRQDVLKKLIAMKTPINIFCAVALLCLFTACHRTVDCPDLDEKVLSWFPYEEGDVIRLKNKMADTLLTIPVSHIIIEHTTNYNAGNDCGGCNDNIQIAGDVPGFFHISVYIEENKITSEHYSLKGVNFYINPIESENYTLNNQVYERVKIFKISGRTLIVARNFGIVGFIDENGDEWLLEKNYATPLAISKIIDVAGCE